jgi:predicted nucleic acid-binding protein
MRGGMTKGEPEQVHTEVALIFDASALINIASSGFCSKILASLECNCLCEAIVWREVTYHIKKYNLNKNMEVAAACSLINITDMSSLESSMYLDFISAMHPNTLDDGEAATMAVAYCRNLIAVLDEKKGRRIANELIPPLKVLSTIDLFRMVENKCQSNGICINSALFNSLAKARMRVLFEDEEWVVQRLSKDQIQHCRSLPKRLRENDKQISEKC